MIIFKTQPFSTFSFIKNTYSTQSFFCFLQKLLLQFVTQEYYKTTTYFIVYKHIELFSREL